MKQKEEKDDAALRPFGLDKASQMSAAQKNAKLEQLK